ncbi:MAG: hypothetical protein IJ109_08355 [Firmicutes bacterium]|nr:hypothetical protein [Bacillota bacterium]
MEEMLMSICPSLSYAADILSDLSPKTNRLDYPAFGAFYCMLLEEWCLAHHECITDVIDHLSSLIHDVNSEFGSYQGGTLFARSEVK